MAPSASRAQEGQLDQNFREHHYSGIRQVRAGHQVRLKCIVNIIYLRISSSWPSPPSGTLKGNGHSDSIRSKGIERDLALLNP